VSVRRDRDGAVLVITIDRPQARNAIDHATAEAIAAALDELERSPELTVGILTGAGGTFSSGMDLKAFLRGEPSEVEGRGFAGVTEAFVPKPLIAAVEGYALAGGFEVVLACDLVTAADDAVFGLPEVKRGLIAGSGGLLRLPVRVPPQVAMEYALTGAPMPAAEAHRWGLVNRLTPPGDALGAALRLAHEIAANAPLSVRATKALVARAPEPEAWARQRALLETIVNSADAREGAEAFVEKRPPNWRAE
jgi:enoyl-CoA hydratase